MDKTLGKRRELIESTLHCENSTLSQLPKLSLSPRYFFKMKKKKTKNKKEAGNATGAAL